MSNFESEKRKILSELNEFKTINKIDRKVVQIIDLINSDPNYYTTSSCSGRAILIALAQPGAKDRSLILGKWHDKIYRDEVLLSIKNWKKYPYLYFIAQSPIFHITTKNINSAVILRNIGDGAGFKYSSIRSIKIHKLSKKKAEKQKELTENEINREITNTKNCNLDSNEEFNGRITVELLSSERLNIPIGFQTSLIVDDDYIDFIIDLANELIYDSNKKLHKLREHLKKKLS